MMRNLYRIDGKKATQKQWYEHLEKLYMKQMPYAELGRLAMAINTHGDFCECKYGSEECGVYDCSDSLQVFCQKRAELQAGGVLNEQSKSRL